MVMPAINVLHLIWYTV